MMAKRASGWKILAVLVAGMLIMSAAFVAISYHEFRSRTITDCVNYSRALTKLIADEILDVEHVGEYMEQGHAFPGYNEIERKLYKLRDAYPDIVYLYVYQMREDGCHVVFDLDTEAFPASEPGSVEEFFPAFRPYIPDLLAGKEVPEVISREKYGYVLSVLTPLYDAEGNCRCYIGADCSMDSLRAYVLDVIRQIALFFLAALAVLTVAVVFLAHHGVIRPMKRLESRAYRDTLTGLLNRTAYYEYNHVINRKIEKGEADFSILMIDINYLKKINDTYGHELGNAYLSGAAQLLRSVFGEDRLYRIGGDEFVIVLEGNAQEAAEGNLRKFKEEVARLQADESLQPWEKISAAAGLAKYEKGEDAIMEDVLRRADEIMYRDKVAMKAVRTA